MSYRPDAAISLLLSAEAQLLLGKGSVWMCLPNSSSTAPLNLGAPSVVSGTVSHATIASTNETTRRYHMNVASANAANAISGVGAAAYLFEFGVGFRLVATIGTAGASTPANQAAFWGLQTAGSTTFGLVGSTNPIDLTNVVGVGYEATETNLQVYHNDASGTCTRIDLGANFPVDNFSIYTIEFWAGAGGTLVYYKVTRLNDGTTASGSISTDLPASSVSMAPRFAALNRHGSTAAVVNQSLFGAVCSWGQ